MKIDPRKLWLLMGWLSVSSLFPWVVLADAGQVAPAEVSAPAAPQVGFVSRPSLSPVIRALQASGHHSLHAVAVVRFDAAGVVHAARLDPGTGVEAVDEALIAWCKVAILTPGAAGEGRLPFRLSIDDSPASSLAELPEIRSENFIHRPPMNSLTDAFMQTGRRSSSLDVAVEYSADGEVVHAEVIRSSGSAALDKAVVNWTKRVRLHAGVAGRGRLPFKFGLQ